MTTTTDLRAFHGDPKVKEAVGVVGAGGAGGGVGASPRRSHVS